MSEQVDTDNLKNKIPKNSRHLNNVINEFSFIFRIIHMSSKNIVTHVRVCVHMNKNIYRLFK